MYAVSGYRTYLGDVLHQEIALDGDDFRRRIVRTLRIIGKSNDPLPPQSSYNEGQKLFAFMMRRRLCSTPPKRCVRNASRTIDRSRRAALRRTGTHNVVAQ